MKNNSLFVFLGLTFLTASSANAEVDRAHMTKKGLEMMKGGYTEHLKLADAGYHCSVEFNQTDLAAAAYHHAIISYKNTETGKKVILYDYGAFITNGNEVAFKKVDTLKALQAAGLCAPYESSDR